MNTHLSSSSNVDGRLETIIPMGSGQIINLAPGVVCEAQVGAFNNAINLFTAIVTFEAEKLLPAHTHPHAESITLLKGTATVEVENRRYHLQQFDNITIPENVVHKVINSSVKEEAVFHIAMPVSTPQRMLTDESFKEKITIPDNLQGRSEKENIIRFNLANRYDAGNNTAFIDYFNDAIQKGVGMSGGIGIFYKNGRLPAHFHAFDESICIISGAAICVTEQNSYTLSDLSTALQPHGLPHYFKNPFEKEMYMIWVYAGAMPLRTEVAEF